jgi:hypothetical protein
VFQRLEAGAAIELAGFSTNGKGVAAFWYSTLPGKYPQYRHELKTPWRTEESSLCVTHIDEADRATVNASNPSHTH